MIARMSGDSPAVWFGFALALFSVAQGAPTVAGWVNQPVVSPIFAIVCVAGAAICAVFGFANLIHIHAVFAWPLVLPNKDGGFFVATVNIGLIAFLLISPFAVYRVVPLIRAALRPSTYRLRPTLIAPVFKAGNFITVNLGKWEQAGTIPISPPSPTEIGVFGSVLRDFMPVRTFVENRRIYVNATIYSGWRGHLIRVERNLLAPNALLNLPGWDYNSNERALEIVNDKTEPIFQLIFDEPSRIRINGVFPVGAQEVAVMDDTRPFSAPNFVQIPSSFVSSGLLKVDSKRIFKYPAWRHPGEFES
jgi:hypothetical protein